MHPLTRALLASIVAASATLQGGASAQTPDEVLCRQIYTEAGDIAACERCGERFSASPAGLACACQLSAKYCQADAELDVELRFGQSTVQNARVTVVSGKGSQVKSTDADGDAFFKLSLDPKTRSVTVKEVTIGPETTARGGVFPRPTAPWTLQLGREVALDLQREKRKKVVITLPTVTLNVTSLYHDEAHDTWAPTSARVMLWLGERKLAIFETAAGKATVDLLAPPELTGKDLRVEGIKLDRANARDLMGLRVPRAGESAFATLHLGDLMTQLERARAKLRVMLEKAFGPEVALRITQRMRFEVGSFATASYDAGVMRIPANWQMSSNDSAETVFHEWGHRIQDVLAPDPPFDDAVGGTTASPWEGARSPALAWDEARANFYSQLLTASLKYPGDKAYRESVTRPMVGRCAGCPGFLASALVTHYRDGRLYGNALEIARDFQAVHDEARRPEVLGHPPRSYAEFVRAKEAMVNRQLQEGRIDAAKATLVKQTLRDVNARFRL